ncbi:serine/threonine protein kinase [Apiospora sp. TS-2023a]
MGSGSSLLPAPKLSRAWNEAFVKYVSSNQKTGIDIDGKQSPYVSHDTLIEYWEDHDRLQHVLDSSHTVPIAADQSRIFQAYLRIWSCLVYIGFPQFIVWFIEQSIEDDHIPPAHDLIPSLAKEDMAAQEMIRAFYDNHWKFWPVLFERGKRMLKRPLHSQCILPITFEDCLTPTADYYKTIVSKVRIDPACCDFENKTVAFKVFQHYHEDSAAFENEASLFEVLPPNSSDVIVQCLGSFKQNQKCVVILELAPGGSLRHFLEKTRRPKSSHELRQLWDSMINLLNALVHLHNLTPGPRASSCAHRDIKPENILVFPKSSGQPYDFDLKLTDFDTSTNLQVMSPNSDGRQNHDGGRTYCAPEASRIQARNEDEVFTVPLKSDVWSLGAVFGEVIVWIAQGNEGIKRFEARRKQETSALPGFRGSGFEACFHTGVMRLNCVDEILEESLGLLLKLDNITPLVKRLTEDYMLVQVESRLDAKPLYQFFANEIVKLLPTKPTRLQTTQSDWLTTPNNRPREPRSANPIMEKTDDTPGGMPDNQEESDAAMSQSPKGQDVKEAPDNHEQQPAVVSSKGPELPRHTILAVNTWLDGRQKDTLLGMDEVLQQLKNRDQLFVIDDSSSMREHKSHLYQTCRALIALASKVDPDRVEMVFTSNPDKFIRDRHRLLRGGANHMVAKIRRHFEKSNATNGTNMEARMGQILTRGVEDSIKTLVQRLIQSSRNRAFITLQFIRFGHDPDGAKRLKYLDDDLPKADGMQSLYVEP